MTELSTEGPSDVPLESKREADFSHFIKGLFFGKAKERFDNSKFISDYLGMLTQFGFIWGLFAWINVDPNFVTESLKWPDWYYWPVYLSSLAFALPIGTSLVIIPLMLLLGELKAKQKARWSQIAITFYGVWLVAVAGIISLISFQPIFKAL
ncbi:MAG: hypothetical protein H2046_07920 [Rhizobiales bacterium]|nr:hypothetical protein [Hyphomicrobiales bacterium]